MISMAEKPLPARPKSFRPHWVYPKPGEVLWEMAPGGEQGVMFYWNDGPFSSGVPPMSDQDCERLEQSLRARTA
jgi:hypothetical protein